MTLGSSSTIFRYFSVLITLVLLTPIHAEKEIQKPNENSRITVQQIIPVDEDSNYVWDLRLLRESKISNIGVSSEENEEIVAEFIPREDLIADNKSATNILFLIDTSDSSRRAKDIEAAKSIVAQLLVEMRPHHRFGLGILGENLQMISEIGTDLGKISEALERDENFPDQKNTYLYRSLVGAIEILPKKGTERSAIVVISDGISEDGGEAAYTLNDVLGNARKKDVSIITIALERLPEFEKEALAMARLSSATNATSLHLKSPQYTIGKDVQERLLRHIDSGGWLKIIKSDFSEGSTVSVTALEKEYSSTLELSGSEARESVPDEISPHDEGDTDKNTDPNSNLDGKNETQENDAVTEEKSKDRSIKKEDELFGLARKQLILIAMGLTALLALCIVVAIILHSRSKQSAENEYMVSEPSIQQPLQPAQRRQSGIFLEDIQNPDTSYPLLSSALRIGRGVDNDIQLTNDSVSKHHAEIIKTSDGRYLVQDLASGNGVYLNGNRIDSGEVKDGDEIEFGEVRLKFINKASDQ